MNGKIVVFSKLGCPYCEKAKDFLESLNLPFCEKRYLPSEPDYETKRNNLFDKYNHRSFPIIVIDDEFLGGYTELIRAHETLKLHYICSKIGLEIVYDF